MDKPYEALLPTPGERHKCPPQAKRVQRAGVMIEFQGAAGWVMWMGHGEYDVCEVVHFCPFCGLRLGERMVGT